jgi:uncharacterized membrane protein YccC
MAAPSAGAPHVPIDGWHNPVRSAFRVDWTHAEPLAALRSTVGVAVPLVLALLWLGPTAATFVAVGAVATGFGSFQGAYRSRAAIMVLSTVGRALSLFIGSLTGHSIVAATVVAAAAGFIAGLAVALGPGAAFVALQSAIVVLVAVAYPADLAASAWRGLLVSAGGLFQTVLVVGLWPLKRFRTERRLIAAVYRSLADYALTLATGSASVPEPHTLAAAGPVQFDPHPLGRISERLVFHALLDEAERIRDGLAALSVTSAPLPAPVARALSAILRETGDAVEAARAPAPVADDWRLLASAPLAEATRARIEALLGQLRSGVRLAVLPAAETAASRSPPPRVQALPPVRDGLVTLQANLSLQSAACRHGLRLAATVGLLTVASHAFGIPRGYWASITALLVLKPEFGETYARGIGRVAGTLVGAGVVVVLVAMLGSHPAMITALLLGFVWSGYVLFRANYAAFTVAITGYIVLLLYLAGVPGTRAAEYRALNTVLGGALALAAYRVWPTWEATRAGDTFAALADAFARDVVIVLNAYIDPQHWNLEMLEHARHAGRLARSNAEGSVTRLFAEPPRDRFEPHLADSLLAAFRRFAAGALTLHADLQARPSPAPELARLRDELSTALETLAAALRSDSAPARLPATRETLVATRQSLAPVVVDALDVMIDSVNTAASVLTKVRA